MLTTRFDEALVYASGLHREQRRKGANTPYIAHLLTVSALTIEFGGDEDQAIAALLHDAAEDHGGQSRLDDIDQRFGTRVALIVADCTDAVIDPKPPWRARKEAYLGSLAAKSRDSLLVSLADKTHNAEAILDDYYALGPSVYDRFTGGREGTIWYYEALSAALAVIFPGRLSRRLAAAVDALVVADRAAPSR